MTPSTASSLTSGPDDIVLDVLRELLSQYVDLEGTPLQASTELAQIGVDSLTLAEVLFALEDRLGVPMNDPGEMPRTVADLIAYALPYMKAATPNTLH